MRRLVVMFLLLFQVFELSPIKPIIMMNDNHMSFEENEGGKRVVDSQTITTMGDWL